MEFLSRIADNARQYAVFTDYFREIESILQKCIDFIVHQNWGALKKYA